MTTKPTSKFRQPTEVDIEIGQKIRRFRQRSKLSLNELAARVGISYQQLQKYETGVNRISAGMLLNLSEALGQDVIVFFERKETLDEEIANDVCLKMRERCARIVADVNDAELLGLITKVTERLAHSR